MLNPEGAEGRTLITFHALQGGRPVAMPVILGLHGALPPEALASLTPPKIGGFFLVPRGGYRYTGPLLSIGPGS
jgi:hypothetical protein